MCNRFYWIFNAQNHIFYMYKVLILYCEAIILPLLLTPSWAAPHFSSDGQGGQISLLNPKRLLGWADLAFWTVVRQALRPP